MRTYMQHMPAMGEQAHHRWQDWINLLTGIWLFFTPWFVSHAAGYHNAFISSAWNACIVGALIVMVALTAMSRPQAPQAEGVNIALSVWLYISPWALGFTGLLGAAWNAWIIGVIVFCLSVWAAAQTINTTNVTTINGEDTR